MLYLIIFGIGLFVGWQRPSFERFLHKKSGNYSVFRVYFNDDAPDESPSRPGRFIDMHGYGKADRDNLYTNILAHQNCGMRWTMGGSIKKFEVVAGIDDYMPYERYLSYEKRYPNEV